MIFRECYLRAFYAFLRTGVICTIQKVVELVNRLSRSLGVPKACRRAYPRSYPFTPVSTYNVGISTISTS